jgi:hypothetical protein
MCVDYDSIRKAFLACFCFRVHTFTGLAASAGPSVPAKGQLYSVQFSTYVYRPNSSLQPQERALAAA